MASANHATPDPRKILSRELRAVGLKPNSAFQALPEWWEEALSHPSGLHEVRGLAAKFFGLEISPDGRLQRRQLPHACFKTRVGTDLSEVETARAVVTAVARVVASATTVPWTTLPSAADLRNEALTGAKAPWVGLEEMLEACWTAGVPVIYLPSLPVAHPKMEGMVTVCGGRPVIVITKRTSAPAWMLFVLAHEMGHIALGHLGTGEGGTIVDENVSEDADGDAQEGAANAYALQFLTGGKSVRLPRLIKAPDLAKAAQSFGAAHGIDPGHLILNAIRNSPVNGKVPWQLANAALAHLHRASAGDVCREALRAHVDVDRLSDDSVDFLERIGLL